MKALIVVSIVAVLAACSTAANAWIITMTDPASEAGLAETVVVPTDTKPGVDIIEIDKFYLRGFVAPMAVVMNFQRQAGDQNTISIVDEMVLNQTAAPWDSYHELLLSEPQGSVGFINSAGARAWQQTGGATRLGGVPSSASSTEIDWHAGNAGQYVANGTFADAPANQLILTGISIDVSSIGVGGAFELKQWPTAVPEPATLSILAVMLGGLVTRRRKA
jgi:hypothetical protein